MLTIYIPNSNIIEIELEDLIQLLKPFILMGDFHTHNQIWGSRDTNERGCTIENFMSKINLCLLNNKSPTYLHPATGKHLVIDLTISNPAIYLDYNWKTNEDNCGSDHYPIMLERLEPELEEKIPRWNLQKAKWGHFKKLYHVNLTPKAKINQEDHNTYFTKTLLSIADTKIIHSNQNSINLGTIMNTKNQ